MGRPPIFENELKKGTWTYDEDRKLATYIEQHGHGTWREVPLKAGLRRCGQSCRLRWTNYLRPGIKRGKFSLQEAETIIHLHALLGNRWSAIATHLPKRTDTEIKNYWNVHLKKLLTKMGIDPITHKSRTISTNLSHMKQWEIARLEAEARLVRESKLVQQINLGPAPSLSLPLPLPLDVLKAWQSMNHNMPIVNLVEDTTMEYHTDSWKASEDLFNTRESPKDERTQNIFKASEKTYQDNHLMEAFTNHLFNDANNENYLDDFDHDTNYWWSILNQSAC